MKRIKLLLAAVLSVMAWGGAQAQTDEQYNAALDAVADGNYGIAVEFNSKTYLVQANGFITDDATKAAVFAVSQKDETDAFTAEPKTSFTAKAFRIATGEKQCFTNGGNNSNVITSTHNLAVGTQDRAGWERQALYLNTEGYFAVRGTNSTSTSWGASAFWTVVEDNDGDGLPNATYSMEQVDFIWKFIPESELDAVKATLLSQCKERYVSMVQAYIDDDTYTEGKDELTSLIAEINAASTAEELNAVAANVDATIDQFLFANASGVHPYNATSYITTPTPVAHKALPNGWEGETFGDSSNGVSEYWNKSAASFYQTVTLPAGVYELTFEAVTRTGMVATLAAGDASTNIATVESSVVNGRSGAATYFDAGNGKNTVKFQLNEEGDVLIKVTADATTGDHWIVWRSFTLTYFGVPSDPLALYKEQLQAAALKVSEVTGLSETAQSALEAFVNEKNTTYSTQEEYEAATAAIEARIADAKALPAVVSYYATIKANVLALADQEVYTGEATINTDDADAAIAAATTTAEAQAAIALVRQAALTFINSVTLNEGAYFDLTDALVDNPTVRSNTSYWTKEGTPNGGNSFGKCAYNECEFYSCNFKFYQTLALSKGTWEFGVTGFHRAGNHNTYFYAGEDKILIPGVESSVVNSMAQAETYFDGGNGKVALKFALEEAGSIEIGIDNKDTETDKWTIFRDFTLKYYGAAIDLTPYQQRWEEALAEAETAKEKGANVSGNEATALNAAMTDVPDGTSKANYIEKTDALVAATQAFNAAIAPYNAYAAYRAETVKLFGEELAATVAAPTTAEEATTAVQNLNIAQYNKVAEDYTFSLNGLIGDFGSWTGTATVAGAEATPNYLTNEHWSGETHAYYEQASTGWGNANGWTIQYEKKCTLPEGDYVIKVAARSSAGTTSLVSCSATDVTITLPNVGAEAKGINKAGEASWTEGEFAKDGKGYGWQWRFLPFSLTKETEVTMTFYAEASTQYQWMSIADGELLSANDVATAVEFDESVDNEIEDINIANVNITRNIKVGYNTVVLPFELTANQVATAFGAGTEVYTFSENSEDPNQATINFTKGDGSIKANTPVLVKATMESAIQSFDGVKVVAPAEGAAVEGTNFVFAGVFGPLTIYEGDFFLSDNKIYKSTGLSKLNAFHAYFINKTGVENVKLFIDGIATRISDINDAAAQNGVLYNLAGQRVSKAQKGIFIQNGKKVLK